MLSGSGSRQAKIRSGAISCDSRTSLAGPMDSLIANEGPLQPESLNHPILVLHFIPGARALILSERMILQTEAKE